MNLRNCYILYFLIISFFAVNFLQWKNYVSPGFEIAIFLIVLVMGIACIYYYGQNDKDLHKVAFLIIILFGIVCIVLTPINDVSDEFEHSVRSEIVSQGQITADYVQIPNTTRFGYMTIKAMENLEDRHGETFLNGSVNSKINHSTTYVESAFAQNPFYSYLPQALGILIAKMLDLSTMWILWLGRFVNLIFYGTIIALAIRKAPVLKFPLFITSLLPLGIYQAASFSVDGMFSSLAILAFSYFLYMYKTQDIEWKDLGIFYLCVILSGLLKTPFLALSLLIFLVPNSNFKNRTQNIASKLGVLFTLAVGVIWSSYATSVMNNSWRGHYSIVNNVNPQKQVNYLLSHPAFFLERIGNLFSEFSIMVERMFCFSNGDGKYQSNLLAYLYILFITLFSMIYPLDAKFELKTKIKTFLIGLLIYSGVIGVLYLTWASVGEKTLISGVYGRYFMPLMVLLPIILNIGKIDLDKEKIKLISLTLAIGFISGIIILCLGHDYI